MLPLSLVVYPKINDIEIKNILQFEEEYLKFIKTARPKIIEELKNKKDIPEELEKQIREAIDRFRESFSAE